MYKDRALLLSKMTESIVVNRNNNILLQTEKYLDFLGEIEFGGHSWVIARMEGYHPTMSVLKRIPNDGEMSCRNVLPEKKSFEALIKHMLPNLDVFRSHFGDAEVDLSTVTFHWRSPRPGGTQFRRHMTNLNIVPIQELQSERTRTKERVI